MRFLCLGDVVGRPGRLGIKQTLGRLKEIYNPDLVVVNGENAAGGLGIDLGTYEELKLSGANLITLGDHAWQKKESIPLLNEQGNGLIRPANYPEGAPGRGWTIVSSQAGLKVGVMNLLGRVFLNLFLDCPFKTAERLLERELKDCHLVICDFHGEATSEKEAFARHFDGRLSLVFGTHTHVQTADERILPGGTAFISDLGMCGSQDGVIGMDATKAIARFLTGMPHAYEVAKGEPIVQGIFCEVDDKSRRALKIERIRMECVSKN